MQISVYCIEKGLFDKLTSEEIIENIVNDYNNKVLKKEQFHEQPLNEDFHPEGFKINIYYSQKQRDPKWKGFLEPALKKDAKLLNGKNHDISYVAFIYNAKYTFAVSGGQGNFMVQDYCNPHFGIDIISRLISENSRVIKALNERGLTGAILASTKYFRFDYRLSDEDEFGKLYKQIKADLDVTILSEKLGFSKEEIRKNIGCVAKSTFQINKSLDMASLLRVLDKLSNLLDEKPNFTLNKAKLISRRGESNKALISKLESNLYQLLYDKFIANDCFINFDICHPEFEEFFKASSFNVFINNSQKPIFEIPLDELRNFSFLFDTIKRCKIDPNNSQKVIDLFKKVKIKSFSDSNAVLTEALLFKHLHGELRIDNKTYFLVDGEWYQIDTGFIENLNRECETVVTDLLTPKLLEEKWTDDIKDENGYNQKYFNKSNFMVLDKVLAENIEVCDLLKFDDSYTYLIHVKQGFKNTIRELTSQTYIAARAVKEVRSSSDYSLIEQLYDSLASKSQRKTSYSSKLTTQAKRISKEKFISLFRDREVVLCLAVYDTATTEREILDMSRFDSNIAKFSIVELNRKMKVLDMPLKIVQIKRGNSVKRQVTVS